MFTRAIVRPPGPNYAQGLTMSTLGAPIYEVALEQHAQYCAVLEQAGLKLTRLEIDHQHPDSTFVEDVAVLTPRCAILTRPGAPSRQGEVGPIEGALHELYESFYRITAPGTLDGGDICQVDDHFLIGISERTNPAGAQQLATILAQQGYTSTCIDIRPITGLLHLKTGLTYLGDRRIVLIEALAHDEALQGYELICTPKGEEYAANCIRINDYVLVPEGYPGVEAAVRSFGYPIIKVQTSEFEKMDGSLTCLSLRI